MNARSTLSSSLTTSAVLVAALFTACGGDPGSLSTSRSIRGEGTCIAPPDYGCAADADCCAGSACFSGTCRIPEGAACTSSESCVAGTLCIQGTCSSQCAANWIPCQDSAECCSDICYFDGTQSVCAPSVNGCVGTSDYGCQADRDCCAGAACFNGTCRIPEGAPCTSSESCVAGTLCIQGTCSSQCAANWIPCQDSAECCSGICYFDGTQSVCAPSVNGCVAPPDYGCQADSDCCGNAACFRGTCFIPEGRECRSSESCAPGTLCIEDVCTSQCSKEQAYCRDSAECCSGLCRHESCVSCLPEGDACWTSADCCSGACIFGVCAASATSDECTFASKAERIDCTSESLSGAR